MLGLLFGITNGIIKGISKVIVDERNEKYDSQQRQDAIRERNLNIESSGIYNTSKGERSIDTSSTSIKIKRIENEVGYNDRVVYDYSQDKIIRNLSEIKREKERESLVKEAIKNKKTVIECPKYKTTLPGEHRVYQDIETKEYYIIKVLYNEPYLYDGSIFEGTKLKRYKGLGKYKNSTYFYMNLKNGHLVRRTDGQKRLDKEGYLNNAVSVEETSHFINVFNKNQNINIKNGMQYDKHGNMNSKFYYDLEGWAYDPVLLGYNIRHNSNSQVLVPSRNGEDVKSKSIEKEQFVSNI